MALAGLMQADGVSPGSIRSVPFTGAATALTDLAAGGVHFVACSMPEAEALIKAGRVRSLVFFYPSVRQISLMCRHRGSGGPQACTRACGAALRRPGPAEGDCPAVETAIKKVWDSEGVKEFMNRRGFDMIYLDTAVASREFMKTDNEDNGKALKSLGLAK